MFTFLGTICLVHFQEAVNLYWYILKWLCKSLAGISWKIVIDNLIFFPDVHLLNIQGSYHFCSGNLVVYYCYLTVLSEKNLYVSLTLFVNSDCGMFGDVLLIFHDTSKLNLGTFPPPLNFLKKMANLCVTVTGPLLLFSICEMVLH